MNDRIYLHLSIPAVRLTASATGLKTDRHSQTIGLQPLEPFRGGFDHAFVVGSCKCFVDETFNCEQSYMRIMSLLDEEREDLVSVYGLQHQLKRAKLSII